MIPAKGTSKRLPGKNIRPFWGRPIIEYTIEAAIESGCFDAVIVATDSNDIKRVANSAGADVFMRSAESCADDAPMVAAVLEVLKSQAAKYVCMAYACAPFIKVKTMRCAYEYIRDGKYDSIFPVSVAEAPERVLGVSGMYLTSRYPEYDNANSEHFVDSYNIAGQFFFCDAEMVKKYETVMLPRCQCVIVPKWEAVDIDTEEDWKWAEMLYGMSQ